MMETDAPAQRDAAVNAISADTPVIDGDAVARFSPMPTLIEALREGFTQSHMTPPRQAHEITDTSSLLLMPAWTPNGDMGVKITTVNREQRPAVQASYLLLDGTDGRTKALLDGSVLTARRTAAASALAADYLARADARTVLLIGTGALIPNLIEAYASVRNIRRFLIWGRDPDKARRLAANQITDRCKVEAATDLEDAIGEADIISAATLATAPIIRGVALRPGMHIDLIGAFRPEMREADPDCFGRASVFVDTREGAFEEAGDLIEAIASGAIARSDVRADLSDLCCARHGGRRDDDEITLFKSVGTSIEDLIGARLVFAGWQHERTDRYA